MTKPQANQDSVSFVYPLHVGDYWLYWVENDVYPGIHWSDTASVVVQADTLMPNGNRYMVLTAMYTDSYSIKRGPKQFLRREGERVLQYFPTDTMEVPRFDFAAHPGDTISNSFYSPFSGQSTNFPILITFLGTFDRSVLGFNQPVRVFSYFDVAESLGIVRMADHGGSRWILLGAKISGREYGILPTSVASPTELPKGYSVSQNFPNPFNSTTTILAEVPVTGELQLILHDLHGRTIHTFLSETVPPGIHRFSLNLSGLSSGAYFYSLSVGRQTITKKLLLLK